MLKFNVFFKVLVDGPETQVPRGSLRLNQLHLTKFKISFPHTASTRVVRAAWKKAEINKKWSESMWSKKVEDKKIVSIINYYQLPADTKKLLPI